MLFTAPKYANIYLLSLLGHSKITQPWQNSIGFISHILKGRGYWPLPLVTNKRPLASTQRPIRGYWQLPYNYFTAYCYATPLPQRTSAANSYYNPLAVRAHPRFPLPVFYMNKGSGQQPLIGRYVAAKSHLDTKKLS